MATAEQIIAKAYSYIGIKENPSGSNNVIFNNHYYGKPVSGKYPWCCVFVWDVFRMCGASAIFYDGKKTAYCPTLYDWAKKKKQLVGKKNGKSGDVVFFDWNANGKPDHVGFIYCQNKDGTYTTIEGNTSVTSNDNGGAVMKRTRKLPEILDIYRPAYAAKEDTDSSVKEGIFVAEKIFKNTSGKVLKVYADTTLKTEIGTLFTGSSCKCLGIINNRALLKYQVAATGAYKVGFTNYTQGVAP